MQINTQRKVTMMAPVIEVSRAHLAKRRAELLERARLSSYDEFRERAEAGVLTDREWGVRDELDSIMYLLGEDDLTD